MSAIRTGCHLAPWCTPPVAQEHHPFPASLRPPPQQFGALNLESRLEAAAAEAGLAPGLGSPVLLTHSPAAGAAPGGGLSQQTPGLLFTAAAGPSAATAAQPAASMVPLSAVGGRAADAAALAGSPSLQQPALPQPAVTEQSDGFVTAREQQTHATGASGAAPTPLSTAASRPDAATAAQLAAAGAAAGAAASVASAIMAAGPGGAEHATAASPSQAESDGSFAFHKASARGSAQPAASSAPTPALPGAGANAGAEPGSPAAAAATAPGAAPGAEGRSPKASGLGLLSAGPAMDDGAGFAEYQFDDGMPAGGVEEVAVPAIDWSAKTQEEIVSGTGRRGV